MSYIKKKPLCAWLSNMGVSDYIIKTIESEEHFPSYIDEWINVNDRLPEHEIDANGDGIEYIICMDNYVTAAYFMKGTDGGSFYSYDCEGRYYWYDGVTHWRYMPEPPSKNFKE